MIGRLLMIFPNHTFTLKIVFLLNLQLITVFLLNFSEFVLVLCNESKKTSRKKQRKHKKRQQQQLNATSGTTTSEAVTATRPTSSTTLARSLQPPQVSGINDCTDSPLITVHCTQNSMLVKELLGEHFVETF